MGQKLAKLEEDSKPGAQERLKSFRKQREDLVESIIEVGLYSAVSIPLSAHFA
jgi:hypothetical protein